MSTASKERSSWRSSTRNGCHVYRSNNPDHHPAGRPIELATEITDPIVLFTLAQTVILTLTMIIFIYQFRAQNMAIKDAAYQKTLDDFSDSIALLIQKPELASLVDELGNFSRGGDPAFKLTPERAAAFGYMLLSYSLFERVYLLYAKKWIDEDTWNQWYTWMKTMAKHPIFQEVHRRSEGTYDREFQKLVAEASKPDA